MTATVTRISNGVVLAALPAGLTRRFRPDVAGDLDATIALRVGEATYAIRVRDGRCKVTRGDAPEAGATLSVSPGDAVRLLTGDADWPALLGARRMQISGDPFLALRFPGLFGLTAA